METIIKSLIILPMLFVTLISGAAEESPFNLLKNPGFESGTNNWAIPQWNPGVSPKVNTSVAVEGSSSLEFELKQGEKISLMQSVRPDKKTTEFQISAWVNTDKAKNVKLEIIAELIYVNKGKTTKKYIKTVVDNAPNAIGWHKLKKRFPTEPGLSQIRVLVVSRSASGRESRGIVFLDCVQLEEIPKAGNTVELRTFSPGGTKGIYCRNQDIKLKLAVVNTCTQDRNAELTITVVDYYNNKIHQEKQNLNIAGLSGIFKKIKIKAPAGNGFYSATASLKLNNIAMSEQKTSFVVVAEQKNNDAFFGINPIGFPLADINAAHLLGAGRGGVRFLWTAEIKPDSISWKSTDERVKEYIRCGFKMTGMLQISGDHYTQPGWVRDRIKKLRQSGSPPYDEEYYKAADKFTRKVIKRYGNRIKEWAIASEIDLGIHHDQWEKQHYIRRVKDISNAIRELCPGASLGGTGVSGVDGQSTPRFPVATELWEKLHNSLDFMAYDPYVDPKTFGPGHRPIGPERGNLRKILLDSLALVRKYGKNSIAIDEKGYKIVSSLPVDSIYAKQLAEVMARGYVLAKSVPENRYWLYFMFSDRHKEGLGDYGLWKGESPRPAAAAYAATARHLAFSSEPIVLNIHNDIFCVVFRKAEKSIAVLWALANEPVRLSCTLPAAFQVYDLMGNQVISGKEAMELQLSPALFFIESDDSAEITAKSLSQSRFTLPELKGTIYQKNISQLTLYLSNQTDHLLDVKLTMPDTADPEIRKVVLEARQHTEIDIPLPAFDHTEYTITAETPGGHHYKLTGKLNATPVKRIIPPVKIDGQFDKYKEVEPLVLNDSSFLFPVDALPNRLWTNSKDLSCKVYLAYDDQYFYLAFNVNDNVMSYHRSGQGLWANDSIQFAFDPDGNAVKAEISGKSGYDEGDSEFAMAMTPEGAQLFCYKASSENRKIQGKLCSFPLKIKREGTHTLYETAIPWSALAPLKPEPGNTFGFNFALFDSDEKGKSPLYWFSLTPGIAGGKKPEAFNTFYLMP
jgi:hypothetical protein